MSQVCSRTRGGFPHQDVTLTPAQGLRERGNASWQDSHSSHRFLLNRQRFGLACSAAGTRHAAQAVAPVQREDALEAGDLLLLEGHLLQEFS